MLLKFTQGGNGWPERQLCVRAEDIVAVEETSLPNGKLLLHLSRGQSLYVLGKLEDVAKYMGTEIKVIEPVKVEDEEED